MDKGGGGEVGCDCQGSGRVRYDRQWVEMVDVISEGVGGRM